MLKKKVLITATHAGYGGVAKYVIDLAEFLNSTKDFEAYIAIGAEKEDLIEKMRFVAKELFLIPHLVRRLSPIDDALAYLEIKKLLCRRKFDIIHSNGPKAGFLFRKVCYELGITNFYTHHLVVYQQYRSMLNGLYKNLERIASRWCNKVIVVTNSAKETLVHDSITPASKIEVIYNGVKDITPVYTKQEARAMLGIPNTRHVLVSVGRLEEPKDPLTTLRALNEIIKKHGKENIVLFFVGDGPLRSEVLRYINLNGLDECVVIKGFTNNVDLYLATADVFVLSTKKEGLPIAILEAMKYSIPIVASAVDGIPEQVFTGRNGFLFHPGDYLELSKHLLNLLEDQVDVEKLGAESRVILEERFLLSKNFNKIFQLYNETHISRRRKSIRISKN